MDRLAAIGRQLIESRIRALKRELAPIANTRFQHSRRRELMQKIAALEAQLALDDLRENETGL